MSNEDEKDTPDVASEVPSLDLMPPAESIAVINSRAIVAELLLALLVKDVKFNDFVRETLAIAMKVIPCEAGSVFEIDRGHQTIFFRAAVGRSSSKIQNFSIPLGQGIVGHVAESCQPLVVPSLEDNAMHLRAVEQAVGFETRNILAAPIMVRGQVYGVIELLNREGEGQFTAGDIELVNYWCLNAARALEARFMLSWALSRASSGMDNNGQGTINENGEAA